MPLDPAQRKLVTANTLMFPAEFPALAKVSVAEVPNSARVVQGQQTPYQMLLIQEEHNDCLVEWRTLVENVAAAFIPNVVNWATEAWWNNGTWATGPELPCVLGQGNLEAIVYLPEDAPVVLRVEVAASAAEARDYRSSILGYKTCDPCG